ncbi:MKRN2 opposite strand protein [Panthera pardus]|uniref:MKRN2 opposite strand n=3 Tax=Panthera TaxID=9688 RepID=A0A8C8WDU4_PANLE|nr:MKRN2 opposite strand protein isoform X2 [Panthera tigris]XP_019289196.1 MKRN2 opposite strand protein [Panthera pardus]XP_042767065.1 MKRN2 opposite strand protein isoform X2 [Panthera leo]XP_049498709.1 MKRN2 opposite strand protein isoform X1 [Panthera uncia]
MHPAEAAKPLIKFNHCKKYIYSFSVPLCCPLCQQVMSSRKLEEAPVSISNPFTNGHQEKCSFLLRPTQGTFLREYDGRSDLHVGITNTNGVVYNYTMHGVQRDEAGWEQSVSIPLLQPGMYGLMDQWDKYLEDFSTSGAWLPQRYEEDHHNCYSYTLTFINCVLTTEGKGQLDKGEFTEKYVVPRTRKASKYITLYRGIEEHGFYVTDCPEEETNPSEGSGVC